MIYNIAEMAEDKVFNKRLSIVLVVLIVATIIGELIVG